jgi:hypothetical protein
MPACGLVGLIPKIFVNAIGAPAAIIYSLVGVSSLAIGIRQITIGYSPKLAINEIMSLKIIFGYIAVVVGLSFVLIALGALKAATN